MNEEKVTGYIIDDICYCTVCIEEEEKDGAEKIIIDEQWDEQPHCWRCGESIDVAEVLEY